MKIAWVTDFINQVGGAERTEGDMISCAGKDFEIVKMNSNTFKDDFDFYILNNFRTFSEIQIDFLINNKKYVNYWHDFLGSPNWNLYEAVINNAELNIFLSPLHFRKFKQFNFDVNNDNSSSIAPYINVNNQLNDIPDFDSRKEDICWLGNIQYHKGVEAVLLFGYNNDKQIHFYGSGEQRIIDQIKLSKYGKYCGVIRNPFEVLKKYKYFIHLPESEAFGRAYAEAILAGCKMIGNDNVGCKSWYIHEELKENFGLFLKDQPNIFWDKIRGAFMEK